MITDWHEDGNITNVPFKNTLMKQISTKNLIIALLVIAPFSLFSQNLLKNSGFSDGSSNWSTNGMKVEINPETTYGGRNSRNNTAEVDMEVGLRQVVDISADNFYQLTFKVSRRTGGGTIASPGINIQVIGDVSGKKYVNSNKTYSNTSFAFVDEIFTFSIPKNTTDKKVTIQFTGYNNNTTLGVIMDDIQFIQINNAALPVHFVSFTGELRNNSSLLTWKTENESNNRYFIIEKSVNGASFDSIGVVAASNRSAATYTFADTKLSNTNVYRIRQVDLDGASIFSKMIVLKKSVVNGEMKVFPSTATTTVQYSLSVSENTSLQVAVVDASGRTVMQQLNQVNAGSFQQSLNVQNLNSGIYYIQVRSNDGSVNLTKTFQKMN